MTAVRSRLLLFAAALFLALAGPAGAQPQDVRYGDAVKKARAAFDAKNFIAAWQGILDVVAMEPTFTKTNEPLVRDAARALYDQAKADVEGDKYERALEATTLFRRPESMKLVEAVFPKNVQDLAEALRIVEATAKWNLAKRELFRGNRDAAEKLLREAVPLLKPTDPNYAAAMNDFAGIYRDRGVEAMSRNKFDEAEEAFKNAKAAFEFVRDNPNATAQQKATAAQNVATVQAIGLDKIAAARQATAPPPPATALDSVFGRATANKIRGVLKGLGLDGSNTGTIVAGIGILVIGYVLLFALPNFLLGKLVDRKNFPAMEWKPRVRYLGPLALVGWLFAQLRSATARTAPPQHACPKCQGDLADILLYDDLDFTRCPHCKEALPHPAHTLEKHNAMLAEALSGDIERVEKGQMSMSALVRKEGMQRLVRGVFTDALRSRASDIHIEPTEQGVVVRYRIDGMLMEIITLPMSLANAIVSCIKAQANLDISEKRLPQDGKLQMKLDGALIDIRVATAPVSSGEKASLRLLDVRSIQIEARHLGMHPKQDELFTKALGQPHGLILITGPTGSGKTTTLYVSMQNLKNTHRNIISIEDPIEFRIPGINQTQVNPVAGLTFATGLRSILRQDPDVIVVGEIRDDETAGIAVNAAATGHLVFSTLHTIDAASSIARLVDLHVQPRQFADALLLVIAQRLVRLVCAQCHEPYMPDQRTIEEMAIPAAQRNSMNFTRGRGCPVCKHTGFYGRTGLFEMMTPSNALRSALEGGPVSTSEIREIAIRAGMKTLREEALHLVQEGSTTAEEMLRITS